MTTNNSKLSISSGSWRMGLAHLALVMASFAPQAGHAQTLSQCSKEVAGCVVNTAKSAYYAVSAVGGAVEFAALHANCVADVAAGNPITIGVTSAIVGVAASGVISASSYDSCKTALYGAAARPLASALVEIIPNDKLKSFALEQGTDLAIDGFEAIANAIPVPSPGAFTLAAQLNCGCAVAAAGAGLIDNLKHMLIATAAAADQCTGAMGCLGAATLNAIADVGKATGKVTVAVAKCAWTPNDCGEKEAIPPEQYWTYNFAPFVPIYADLLVTNANTYCSSNSIYVYQACTPAQELENKRNECMDYHKAHKASADTARKICNSMRDRLLNESQVIVSRRMADEVFPKLALEYVKATFPLEGSTRHMTGDFAFCNAPKDPNKTAGIDLTGASYYTMSAQSSKITQDCINAMLRSIGIDASNRLVLNASASGITLLAEAKALAQKKNWNFVDTFTVAYGNWESRRNAIKNTYQNAVLKAAKDDGVYLALNAIYAKSARDVYVAGITSCPKAGAVGHLDCIKDMRSYMGMRSNFSAQNPADGYIDFSAWGSTPPKPYISAMGLLEKVKAQNGNVPEAVSGAVAWAMQDAAKMLTTFPAKSVAEETSALKLERERQNAQVAKVQGQLEDNYVFAKTRCKQSSCTPKIDAVRQVEKIDEANHLKKLVAATGANTTFRGLDAYLADMKALELVTRPKYKTVLDLEVFVLPPDDQKRIGAGLVTASATPVQAIAGGAPQIVSPGTAGTVAGATIGAGGKPIGQTAAVIPEKNQPSGPVVAAIPPPQQVGGLAATPPKPAVPNVGPIGMPGAPTMARIAVTPARAPAIAAPAVTPPAAPPVVVAINQAAVAGNKPVDTSSPPAIAKPVSDLLPFDATAYRKLREKEVEGEWLPKCANNAACVNKVNEIADKLLDAEVAGLKSGTPLHTDKAAVTAFQNSLDPIYDQQFKDALPKIATYQPPSGQAVTNNQTAPPKVVVTVTPFDAATYRKTREKEIEAEWMPKCAGNSTCLSRMNAIVDKLLDAEVNALKSGTPDHTNKNALIAFQNSLDPIYDPQFKAAIPAAPPPPTQATVSNKKPTFNNVTIK